MANDQSAVPEPLRSVHTTNLPTILDELAITLLVTTYQSGKLVLLRADNGVLNTHFRQFDKPMGLAVQPNRIALGTSTQVTEFHNLPAVAGRLNSTAPRPHDACFLPRVAHWTGDVHIHEMAWIDDEVVFVNTLFSCLARRSNTYNFEPVWRPEFIRHYTPEDCCHLNGLGVRDGKARYVTALGETNQPAGWRVNQRDGGVVIDVESNEIIARGLSMPHSPRWYNDRLFLLQSGTGGFGTLDLRTGNYESIVELPGFTRGLAFAGPLAFIGLSQVRETSVFGGAPIAQLGASARVCGVWVVNIETGQVIGYVKFEDALQEIFAVEVLAGSRFPELIGEDRELLANSFELPDEVLKNVPERLRDPAPQRPRD